MVVNRMVFFINKSYPHATIAVDVSTITSSHQSKFSSFTHIIASNNDLIPYCTKMDFPSFLLVLLLSSSVMLCHLRFSLTVLSIFLWSSNGSSSIWSIPIYTSFVHPFCSNVLSMYSSILWFAHSAWFVTLLVPFYATFSFLNSVSFFHHQLFHLIVLCCRLKKCLRMKPTNFAHWVTCFTYEVFMWKLIFFNMSLRLSVPPLPLSPYLKLIRSRYSSYIVFANLLPTSYFKITPPHVLEAVLVGNYFVTRTFIWNKDIFNTSHDTNTRKRANVSFFKTQRRNNRVCPKAFLKQNFSKSCPTSRTLHTVLQIKSQIIKSHKINYKKSKH